MSGYAFLVDTTKCSGCRACQVACKQWNNLPAEKTEFFGGTEYTNPAALSAITLNHVVFFPVDMSDPEKPVWTIMHKKCYHCAEANCIAVCPQKAISKKEGWTIIDQSKCIGCGECMGACVYGVPCVLTEEVKTYGTEKPIEIDKSYKCHACLNNPRDVPACANTCPNGALTYGKRDDLVKKAQDRLKTVKNQYPGSSIYGLKEFGGLNVITILKDAPEKYELPVDVKPIEAAKIKKIHDMYALFSVLTPGIPALKRIVYRISKNLS